MLVKAPNDRISLEAAMAHPFIQNITAVEDPSKTQMKREDMVVVLDSLQKFINTSQSRQLVMKLIAFSLSPAQISTLRDEFHSIDTNRNGTISMSEMHASIRSFKSVSSESLERHCEQLGLLGDDQLNYNEFIAAAMCKRISIDEERLHVAFESIDESKTGYISAENIRRMLGGEIEESVIKEMFSEIDINNDGKIEYVEFLKYWRAIMIRINVTPMQKFKNVIYFIIKVKLLVKIFLNYYCRVFVKCHKRFVC